MALWLSFFCFNYRSEAITNLIYSIQFSHGLIALILMSCPFLSCSLSQFPWMSPGNCWDILTMYMICFQSVLSTPWYLTVSVGAFVFLKLVYTQLKERLHDFFFFILGHYLDGRDFNFLKMPKWNFEILRFIYKLSPQF